MKRRNFLITAAAAAASTVLPQRAEASAVVTGVDWGAPGGDRSVYSDDLTRICRVLNPMTFLKACKWPLSGADVEFHAGVDLPALWRYETVMPTSILYGRHVDSHEVANHIHWTVGPSYAETTYPLPDGRSFGFAMGEMQSPVCKFPRDIDRRQSQQFYVEPEFWLHVRGNFVQEYLQAACWAYAPKSNVLRESTFGAHQTANT